MVFLTEAMQELGVKVQAVWKRYSHYGIRFLVPDEREDNIRLVMDMLNETPPGTEEMLMPGATLAYVEVFSHRSNYVPGWKWTGYHELQCNCYYSRNTPEN